MPSIYLKGQVFYSDMTPASNVSVKIRDLDLGPNGINDNILARTTNTVGKFSGNSSNWRDREGKIGPFDIPDILNLQFEVRENGHSHKGPFIRIGNNSAPIILSGLPPKPVSRQERELVFVVLLSNGLQGNDRDLYRFIEFSAENLTTSRLGNDYRQIHILKESNATLQNFKNELIDAGDNSQTKAVDVIFSTHGMDSAMLFADRSYTETEVKTELLTIPNSIRRKFRILFSTACFGQSHSDTWRGIGFKAVSGSEGIYADSAVSYLPFLLAWEAERQFSDSVQAANAADLGNVNDNLAKTYFRSQNRNSQAELIDSNRILNGNGSLRIYSEP